MKISFFHFSRQHSSLGVFKFFPMLLCLVWHCSVSGQSKLLRGKVIDKQSNEGVPFCNIFNSDNTGQGAFTDLDGYFEFEVDEAAQTLEVSAVGYKGQQKKIGAEAIQEINFSLEEENFTLEEAVVRAGEDPSMPIIRKMIEKRDLNKINRFDYYQCEMYSKTELDIKNIDEKLRNSKVFEPFAFVFENIDSTSEAEPFLPAYISETMYTRYFKKDEDKKIDKPQAQKVSGLKNNSIVNFIDRIHIEYNAYDEFITVIDKAFVSPFSSSGPRYYEYYLYDSMQIEQQKTYRIKFVPKRKQENTFSGYCWVDATNHALVQYDMDMSDGVNINFVGRVKLGESYTYSEAQQFWLPKQKNMIVEFLAMDKAPGIIGRKTESFKKYSFETVSLPDEKSFRYQGLEDLEQPDTFWLENRHGNLTKNEATIYSMVDSIQKVPIYKTYSEIIYTIMNGYLTVGKVEIGPYSQLSSSNMVEGSRFRLGIRTNTDFSKKIQLRSYLAYGLRDEKFKYGVGATYLPRRNPRLIFDVDYFRDTDVNVPNDTDLAGGNFASALLQRRGIIQKLIDVERFSIRAEQFFPNYMSVFSKFSTFRLDPYGNVFDEGRGFNYSYMPDPNRTDLSDTIVNSTEVTLGIRYAYQEEYLDFNFSRTPLPGKYPIVILQYTAGINGLMGGNYDYHKLELYTRYWFNLRAMGWTRFIFRAGKVFGNAPFLLLDVANGNETFMQGFLTYNAMNRFEFAADQYASLIFEHHFDGFFLNRIPLLRKLKWRSVVTFKGYYGTMSDENFVRNRANAFGQTDEGYVGFRAPSDEPYMETAVGIENIFKIIRIDAIFRMNYLDNPEALPFAIKGTFAFKF